MSEGLGIIRYERACRALAEAVRVDEILKIRDQALALRACARVANNRKLEADAVELRMRATRRMDQMRREQKATIGLAKGGGGRHGRKRVVEKPTLKNAGIGKNLAQEGRRLGALSDCEFEKAVTTARESVGRVVRDAVRGEDKRQRRAERERELGTKQAALPDRKFGVVLEDYEWDFEVFSRQTGMDRHAANHYPVSDDAHTAQEIVDRTKDRLACTADDCALFMWTTVPHLAIGIDVLRLRGFRYVTNWAWDKIKIGTGFWNRNRHEHLLLGIRGNIPCPAPGEQWESLFSVKATEHSAKPEHFLEMIEAYFPNLPKIELNRRGPARPGWDAWGDEVGTGTAPDDGIPEFLRRKPKG